MNNNKLVSRKTIVLHVIVLFICLLVTESKADTITIGASDWCPYMCKSNQDQMLDGYVVDLLKAIFEGEGHTVVIQFMPYTRQIVEARKGRLNAISAVYKPSVPDFIFPKKITGESKNQFYALKNSSWRYDDFNSIKRADKIGVMKSYNYDDGQFDNYVATKPENIIVLTGRNSMQRFVKMMFLGRLTAFVDDRSVTEYNLSQLSASDQIKVVGKIGEVNDVYTAFSPALSISKSYAKTFDLGIKAMRDSGELQSLLSKYGLKDWRQTEINN